MSIDINSIVRAFIPNKILSFEKLDLGGVNVENAFKITASNGNYILKDVRDDHIDEVNNSAKLSSLLLENGFKYSPINIKSKDNNFIYRDSDNLNWEIQNYIEGEHVNAELLTSEHIINLANVLAKLHTTFLNKSKPQIDYLSDEVPYNQMFNSEHHTKMIEIFDNLSKQQLIEEDGLLLNQYWFEYLATRNEILSELKDNENNFQKSIIHRDLNKGNIMFATNLPTISAIVDWDTVVWGNIIQDICYLCSHYLISRKNSEIDSVDSRDRIQIFVDAYQEIISLKDYEKKFMVTLVNILLVRATRWWIKRYIELFNNSTKSRVNKDKFNKFREGFRTTLENWLKDKNTILNLFSKVTF